MQLRRFLLFPLMTLTLLAADPVVDSAHKKLAAKKYDEAISELEGNYKTKPKPEVKQALAEANLAKADAFMYDDSAPPRVRYSTALRAYRETLKYDPKNKKAQDNIATIEGIYKQMGRPIPQ
jgi:tetratricopeptide (TPR) repeat protein